MRKTTKSPTSAIMQWFKKQELARKLIMINFLLVVIPLGALGAYAFSGFQQTMEKNVGDYQLQAMKQVTLNIDTYMNELNRLTLFPYQYKEIMAYVASKREPDQPLTLKEIDSLNSFVSKIFINGRIDIMGVSLFGEKGASYVVLPDSQYITNYRLDKKAEWLNQTKGKFGKPTFITTHSITATGGDTYQVFSIARELRSFGSGETLGYIVIDINPDAVLNILSLVKPTQQQLMYVMDQNGKLVISRNPGIPSMELGDLKGEGFKHVKMQDGGSELLVAYVTSPVTGWTTVSAVPVNVLMNDSFNLRNSIVLAITLCVGLAMIFSVFIAFRITKPLRNLSRLMKKVEQGDLLVSFPVTGKDEIGRLGGTFNTMVSKLSELGFLLYETEIREKDAQIAALQSKINPHFLYNTLGSISMYAEIEGNREIVTMANNLSRLLRYSLSSRKETVTLRDEMVHVNEYMTIQKMRYEERIRMEVNMDEKTLDCKVIPLIIQPIVENALNHAIDKGAGIGLIRIQSAIENGNLKVVVEDDGIGLSAAQLDALRVRLKHSKDLGGTSGNGLLNVHRRILLHYGEPFGLSLESMPYQGFKVMFTLPVNRADSEQETN